MFIHALVSPLIQPLLSLIHHRPTHPAPLPPPPPPTPHAQLAKMYEDEEDDLNSDDPERRAAAGKRRARQLAGEAQEGEDGSYLDDHHYVPGAGGQSASLSPHHEGYDEGAARRLRQRLVTVEVRPSIWRSSR